MDLGVCVASSIDDIEYAVLAEELGYSHLWFADSQMLWSDCYATMALAATRTERIKIGTGVAVAGTRSSAVTAAAHATINRLAPGRVFCGIGTGNTANRVMGAKPMPIAEFERYIAELRILLDGGEAEVAFRGGTRPVRHVMPDAGFVDFAPRMPLYVSGFGPRAMALAVRHGDGLVTSVPPNAEGLERMWARLEAAADDAGTRLDRSSFLTATLTTMVVLEPGETLSSERVRQQSGAMAIASLHYLFEQWKEAGRPERTPRFDFWDDYVAMLDATDPERLHQRIHQGHNCWVLDEEWRFVTPELIAATCMVGTADDLVSRLRELGEAGLGQVMILPPLAVKEDVLRDVATQVMPRHLIAAPVPRAWHLGEDWVRMSAMGCQEPSTRPARRRRRSLLAAAAVGLLTLTAAACRVPSRYDEATIISGLQSPWDMAFQPDGSFFFTERVGTINWGTTAGQRALIAAPGDVVAAGEGGMMGVAVDPDFAANRRIYACYMTASDIRVVRFVVAPDNRSTDGGTPIVTGIERSASGVHSGCRTRFDQFKTLFVTTGDATRGTNPQNLNPAAGSILNGKVLRVSTDGTPVEGNIPINGATSMVYAYGFRNPQGISFRPSDGWPFLIEHGADRDDEITPIHPGANGGWNPIPGYNQSVPMTDFGLPNVVAPQWTSGFPTIAPSGGTFVTSALWGDRAGQMAVAVLKGQQLRMINLNPGVIESGGPVVSNLGRIRVAVESPFDGRLYVLIDAPSGAIVQITPVL